MKVGRAGGFCPSLVPEGFPSGPGETTSLRSPAPILAKMSHIESPLCRERESTVSAPSPLSCTLGLLSGCVPAGARLPWGGWYSPREYSMCCMVLSLAGVPGVPLIPFPGHGSPLMPSGPSSFIRVSGCQVVANTVTLTAVYYKLIHSFRPCCSVTGCHSDCPGS